jgi:predicted nucleic acid-binding protein
LTPQTRRLTPDVQLAAYAIERGAIPYSNDTDFGRLAALKCKNPLDTSAG